MAESSGEKTEQPTQKRLRDARKKGQVAKSQDLSSALVLLAAVGLLSVAGPLAGAALAGAMREGTRRAASFRGVLDPAAAVSVLHSAVFTLALVLAPFLLALMVIALLAVYLQVGSLFAAEALKPDIKKLNPVEAFTQKFFKARPYVEMLKTLLKMTAAVAQSGEYRRPGSSTGSVRGAVCNGAPAGDRLESRRRFSGHWRGGRAFTALSSPP
jgi:flagellar biosynthetic protein FlhB